MPYCIGIVCGCKPAGFQPTALGSLPVVELESGWPHLVSQPLLGPSPLPNRLLHGAGSHRSDIGVRRPLRNLI
jgi:hypothetical protein